MSQTRTIRLSLSCLALLLLAAPPAHTKSPKGEKWIRVETGDVLVFSNAKESRAVEVTRQLAQFRSVLGRVVRGTEDPLPRARVFLLKNRSSYDRYGRTGTERAYYSRTPFESFIVLNATPIASTRARATSMQENSYTFFPYQDMFHEFVHYLFDRGRGTTPLWLGEGLAEYYSTYTTKKGKGVIGLPFETRAQELRSAPWLAPELLFESPLATSHPLLGGLFYAQSWAVVHYMVTGSPDLQRQLNAYVKRVGDGVPQELAFAASFELDEAATIEATRQYLEQGQIRYMTVDLLPEETAIEPRVTVLKPQEALAIVGRLMISSSPERAAAAKQVCREALEIDPGSSDGHVCLALVAEVEGESEIAGEQYRLALESAPDEVSLMLRYGFDRVESLSVEPDAERRKSLLAEARTTLRRATEVDPDSADAHLWLARTWLQDDSSSEEAFAALHTARELRPADGEAPVVMTLLYLRDGERERAEAVLMSALRSYPFPLFGALQNEVVSTSVAVAAGSGPTGEEVEEIVALLETMSGEDPPPALARGIGWDDLRPELVATAQAARLLDVARAVRAGESERARGILREVFEDIDDASVETVVGLLSSEFGWELDEAADPAE